MKRYKFSYAKYGYIFSIPFIVAFSFFMLYPIYYTTLIGFTDLKGVGNQAFKILEDPFANFKLILDNKSFNTALKNTVKIWLANFIPQILLALLLTAWFTDRRTKIKGQGLFKVLFYMPNIITAATIAILFKAFFDYPMSPVNDIFMKLGILDNPKNFLISKDISRGVVAFIQFWMWYGYTMIILVSGVLGISPDIYEAAEIDGAGRIQTFFLITIPNIKTILLFTLITSLIGGLNMFDIPKLFMLGGPDNATLTTSVFIYNQAFSGSYMYNRAAAASMIMFLIIAVLSALVFFIMRDKDEIVLRKQMKKREKEFKMRNKLIQEKYKAGNSSKVVNDGKGDE